MKKGITAVFQLQQTIMPNQAIFGGTINITSVNSPEYGAIFGRTPTGLPASNPIIPIPTNITLSKLYVILDSQPGLGESVQITVQKNGTDTLLTTTISGAINKTGNNISDSFSANAGDFLTVHIVESIGSVANVCAFTFIADIT